MYLIVQCVVYRAYEDMLLVKASGDVFSVAPGFPDKNTLPVRKKPQKNSWHLVLQVLSVK